MVFLVKNMALLLCSCKIEWKEQLKLSNKIPKKYTVNNISKTTRKQHVLIKIASTGIGYATAIYLNKIGFKVFAGVRNERLSKEYQFDFSLLYKEDNIVFSPISFENQLFDNKLI